MYDRFYRFREEPFRLSPDHHFAYAHKSYAKARAYMAYAFMRAEGFVMVTGRPGTGKTTLVGALVENLGGENVHTANLVCTQLQADDLLKLVAYEFGVPPAVVGKGELLQQLESRLRAWHRDARRALLIVDEAQDLSVSAMEELRLLTNIQVEGRPLLQIFLVGQPELRELILRPELEQVHQRIVAASHLRPLESDEVRAYVLHRLEAAGWTGEPALAEGLYPLIHRFSEGIPRRINLICSRLLLHCAVEGRRAVSLSDLRTVIGELQEENLAAGVSFTERDFQEDDAAPAPIAESASDAPRDPAPEVAPGSPPSTEPPAGAVSAGTMGAETENVEPRASRRQAPEETEAPETPPGVNGSASSVSPRGSPAPRIQTGPALPAGDEQRARGEPWRHTPTGDKPPLQAPPVRARRPRAAHDRSPSAHASQLRSPVMPSARTGEKWRLQGNGWPIIVIFVVSLFVVGWAVSGFPPLP